jgi:hypothetical protein
MSLWTPYDAKRKTTKPAFGFPDKLLAVAVQSLQHSQRRAAESTGVKANRRAKRHAAKQARKRNR